MRPPDGAATGVVRESRDGRPELAGDVRDDGIGRVLAHVRNAARVAKEEEDKRVAEPLASLRRAMTCASSSGPSV